MQGKKGGTYHFKCFVHGDKRTISKIYIEFHRIHPNVSCKLDGSTLKGAFYSAFDYLSARHYLDALAVDRQLADWSRIVFCWALCLDIH